MVAVIALAALAPLLAAQGASAVVLAAPPVLWGQALGADTDTGLGVSGVGQDATGATFVTGQFQGPVTFGGTALPTNGFNQGIYLAKYDSAGAYQWAISIRTESIQPVRMATAPDGTTYLAGVSYWSTDFGAATGAEHALTFTGPVQRSWVIAYATDGSIASFTDVSPTGQLAIQALALAPTGGVVATGTYDAGATFAVAPTAPLAGHGGFVMRFDNAGAVVSSGVFGLDNYPTTMAIATDPAGRIHLGLAFDGSVTFPTATTPTTLSKRGGGFSDVAFAVVDDDAVATIAEQPSVTGTSNLFLRSFTAGPAGETILSWSDQHLIAGVSDGTEVQHLASRALGATGSWDRVLPGKGWVLGLTADAAGVIYAAVTAEEDGLGFGALPDDGIVTRGGLVALESTGALRWLSPASKAAYAVATAGGTVSVAGLATFNTSIGVGAGAVPLTRGGSFAARFSTTSVGTATNLGVAIAAQPAAILRGGDSTVTVTVTNHGSSDAASANVAVASPALTITGGTTATGSYAAGLWSLGTLAGGATATIELAVHAPASATCELAAVVATASFTGQDTRSSDDTATADVSVQPLPVAGTDPVWAILEGDGSGDIAGNSASNAAGTSVVVGAYDGNARFGVGAGEVVLPTPTYPTSHYLAVHDASGELQWATTLATGMSASAIDASGHVFVGGYVETGVTVGTGPTAYTAGTNSGYLAAFGSDGTFAWAVGTDLPNPRLAVLGSGSLLVAGTSRNGGAALEQVTAGAVDWRVTGDFSVLAMAARADGSSVIAGEHVSSITIGTTTLPGGGSFLAGFDAAGVGQWAVPTVNGLTDAQLAIDASTDDIVETTYTTTFGAQITRYDDTGTVRWVHATPGGYTRRFTVVAPALALDSLGNAYIAGGGVGGEGSVPVYGEGNSVLAQFAPDATLTWVRHVPLEGVGVAIADDEPILIGSYRSDELRPVYRFGPSLVPVCGARGYSIGLARFANEVHPSEVHGTVTAPGGGPAAGVTVSLLGRWPSWTVAATTTTDAAGHYSFPAVVPGTYRVRFFDGQGRYQRQWWSAADTYSTGGDVVVGLDASVAADATLVVRAGGAIEGHITDRPSTQALAGASVRVYSAAGFVVGATTNSWGGFRINGLAAGSYWIQVSDPSCPPFVVSCAVNGHKSQWAPGTDRFGDATPITVGTTVMTVNVSLPRWK